MSISDTLVRLGNAGFGRRGLLLPVAVILLLIPSPPLAASAVITGLVGLVLALLGQGIRITTVGLAYIIRGGRDHKVYAEDLVTTGLYAHCRNPMYLGNAFLLAGLAVASNSWVFVLVGVPLAVGLHVAMVAAEEHYLRGKFGERFVEYCARVPRFIPRLGGLRATLSGMPFNWTRVIEKEYAEPVDWLSATALVAVLALWRSGELGGNPLLVALMVLVVLARLLLWMKSRAGRRRAAAKLS